MPDNPQKKVENEAARKAEEDREKSKEESGRAFTSATSELLFVVLPFVVIAMTLGHRGQFRSILSLPEWSIVSAVIVGQTIVKFVSISVGRSVKKELVVLVVSMLLVLLLVPVLVVLAIVLTSDVVSIALATTQAVLFIISATVFFLGSIAEVVVDD